MNPDQQRAILSVPFLISFSDGANEGREREPILPKAAHLTAQQIRGYGS